MLLPTLDTFPSLARMMRRSRNEKLTMGHRRCHGPTDDAVVLTLQLRHSHQTIKTVIIVMFVAGMLKNTVRAP